MTGPRLSYEDFQRAGSPDLSYAAFAAPKRRAGDKRPLLERIGAGAQTFTDAASFGGVGLLDDAVTAALSRSTLQEKRDERKASKVLFAEEHPKTALGLQIAGTFATPIPGAGALRAGVGAVRAGQGLAAGGRAIGAGTRLSGTFLKASAPGTGGFRIAGRAGAEGALQGALTGVGQNIGTSEDPMGLQHGTMGATIGGVGGAALTGLLRGGQGLGAGYKAFRAQNLGQSALARKDLMGDTDAINYAKAVAEGKAAGGSTRAVREALDSKTIKFYTKQLRGSETFQNADDATLAREAYKLMSEEQGTLISTIGMTAKDRAKAKIRNGDIQLAKERLLRAVEQGEELVVPGRTRVTGPPPPTTREAIERLHAARAEAARREGVNVDRSPFAGRSPAATDVIQQGRFDQFRRTAGELDAQGNVTLGGIKPAELDPSGMTMSRGDAPRAGPQGPPGSPSRTNETSAQQGAREAMERLDAARLARTGAGAPRPDTRITDPQTYVHTRGLMPSLRTAVRGHAVPAGEREAAVRTQDMIERIAKGKDIKGAKQEIDSPEKWIREIRGHTTPGGRVTEKGYTQREAQTALETAHSWLREVPELSVQPLQGFGLFPTIARSLLFPARLRPYIELLEAQAGHGPRRIERLPQRAAGVLGRSSGSTP